MIYIAYYLIISLLFVYISFSKMSCADDPAFTTKRNKKTRNITVISALLLILIVALRHPSMGVDLGSLNGDGYIGSFYLIGKMTWKSILSNISFLNYSIGYIIYNKLLYLISPNHELLLIVTAFISIAPFWFAFYKFSKSIYFSAIIYMASPLFLLAYSGLRQIIAIGICCIALYYLVQKRLLKFVICVAVAFLFHSSALLFLVAYPVYYIRIKRTNRLILLSIIPVVYIFRKQLFSEMSGLFGYSGSVSETGAGRFLLFLIVLYVFLTLLSNEETNGWLNLLFVACLIQTMAGVNSLVLRAGYYFLISLPIAVPNVMLNAKKSRGSILALYGAYTFFVLYGIYTIIYNSGWAEAYPYAFFWESIM